MSIAWSRIVYGVVSALIGAAAGYFGRDWIVGNQEAVNLIATIFSVLAGFLVAVMALVADERMVQSRGSRYRYLETKNIRSKLTRHKLLFQLYLVVMLLAFAATLKLGLPSCVSDVLYCAMLGLAVFAFLVSFGLPSQITAEYMRKLAEIEKSQEQTPNDGSK